VNRSGEVGLFFNGKSFVAARLRLTFCESKKLNYNDWKREVFDLEATDPCSVDTDAPAFCLSLEIAVEFIDRCLNDHSMYRFTEKQLCCGFNLIFSFTNYPFAYYELPDVNRSVLAIRNLQLLYSDYFQKFCTQSFAERESANSPMLDLCYSFWDMFPLFPSERTPAQCIDAALDVMESAMILQNPHCVAGSLQGVAWWNLACTQLGNDRPRTILRNWQNAPTSNDPELVAYCNEIIEGWLE
jgi:hypothetical protein